MTAKQYLGQAFRLSELIGTNLQELERLRADGYGGIGDAAPKITDLDREISTEIDAYADLLAEIRRKIDALPNKDSRLMLHKRYILHETYEQIADELHYSMRGIYYLHRRALREFAALHPCNLCS